MSATLNETPPLLITESECARLLNCSEKTLFRMRKTKAIPFIPMGRAIRYSRAAIEQFIEDAQAQSLSADDTPETANGHE
ncbi:MAG: transcriptional regulator [Gimesia sp.]|nr:transcriptional regulator [Gimesia sp.]